MHELRILSVLREFALTLLTDASSDASLHFFVTRIAEILPVAAVGATVFDSSPFSAYISASNTAARLLEQMQADTGQGPCIFTYKTGTETSIEDIARAGGRFPLFCQECRETNFSSIFSFPLSHAGDIFGALDIYQLFPGKLDSERMYAVRTLTTFAGAYIANARNRDRASGIAEQLRTSSLRDALTGLPNRRLFEQRVEQATKGGGQASVNSAILFVDLDDFKQVNDLHGHFTGDALLVAVGERLSSLMRTGDTVARISGDEFVIFCESLQDQIVATNLAERVRDSIAAPFILLNAHGEQIRLHITASIGISYTTEGRDKAGGGLIESADAAMYRAKRDGGDTYRLS